MGIDTAGAQLLFAARALGADFTDSLMLGRQFFYPDPPALAQMFRWQGIERDAVQFLHEAGGWSEAFFRLLGATTVQSLDASSFEGASLIHDLNLPIDDSLRERFSLVFDGGTLEHVFQFPQALRNCMEMLREGGWLILYSPANNFMGHGFYQFSPELIYRALSRANGFETVAVLLQEAVRGGRWYTVADPDRVGKRVQMTNRLPTNICAIARRVARASIFQVPPAQSDYAAGWKRSEGQSGGVYRPQPTGWWTRLRRFVEKYLPARLERWLRTLYTPALEAQPDCYRRLDASRLVCGKLA
jgi:SAM-dependent methyltransferase